jgi:predicted GH43/DUF377 family glycosyl hydrolase
LARGVYILALRDNSYYHWAVNLAASVKLHSPELFITLLHDGNFESIPINERFVFDNNIKINEQDYIVNGEFQPGHCKLSLYNYFSYDENIYLDADSIAISPLEQLFTACSDNHVGLQIVKKYSYQDTNWDCIWMLWDELKKAYQLPEKFKIVEINSSFIYTKKTTEAEKFWKQAKANYIPNYKSKWGNKFPDELGFDVAVAQTGINVEFVKSSSVYPCNMNGKKGITQLAKDSVFLSYWGGKHHEYAFHYKNYDLYSQKIHRDIFGKHNPYKIHNLMKNKMVHQANVRITKIDNSQAILEQNLKAELSQFKTHIFIDDTQLIDSSKLLKSYKDLRGRDLKVTNWLNGSIIKHNDKTLFCYRMEMPQPRFFENQKLGIVDLDKNYQPIEKTNKLLDLHSSFKGFHVEDPRLFENNGELMLAYTDGYKMGLANLSNNDKGSYLESPKKNAIGHDGREKNWTPFSYNNEVHFVYNTAPVHTVFDLKGNIYQHEWNADFKYGYLRGGTPAYNMGDYYLSFFHSSYKLNSEKWGRVYFAGAYAFESKPPFKPIAYTKEPLIKGEFMDMGIARPCNVVFVVFPCGAVLNNGEWTVSFGYNDYENRIFKIKDKELWSLMSYCK